MAGSPSNGSGDDRIGEDEAALRVAAQEAADSDDRALLAECRAFFNVLSSVEEALDAGVGDHSETEGGPTLRERWRRVVMAISGTRAMTVEGLACKVGVVNEFLRSYPCEDPSDLLVRSVFRDVESLMAGELRSTSRQ